MKPDLKSTVASDLAFGVMAGLVGTAAMSLSQQIEMSLTGRTPSATPAEAACLMLGIEIRTEAQEQRLAQAHWAYGTMWGIGHSVMPSISGPARALIYLAAVWGTGAALLSGTGLAPPPSRWKPKSLLSDLIHHAVYTAAGTFAYHALRDRHSESRIWSTLRARAALAPAAH